MIILKISVILLILCLIETKSQTLNDFNENNEKSVLPEKCTNKALNSLLENLTPEDYEEAKVDHIYNRVNHINQTIDKFERMQTFSQNVSKKFEPITKRLTARMSELMMTLMIEMEVPSQCTTALLKLATGIQEKKDWAIKFVETLPAPDSGLIQNNKPSIGYDECLEFEIPDYELNSEEKVKGQYCWLGFPDILPEIYSDDLINDTTINWINEKLKPFYDSAKEGTRLEDLGFKRSQFYQIILLNNYRKTFMTKLPIGLCLPKVCKAQDIENALNKVLYPIIRLPLVINPDCDYANKPIKLNGYQRTAILIFACLIILAITSTLYLLIETKLCKNRINLPFVRHFCQSFNIISNFKKVFESENTKHRFQLLDGIRTILSFWVLFVHEHLLDLVPLNSKQSRVSVSLGFFHSFKYILQKNFNFMETFFFIGGMMTCYVMLSKLEKSRGKFNYIQYSLFRYARVIPATVGAILLIYIYPLIGSGPNWELTTSILYVPCRDNWLGSVLMTNNIDVVIPTKYICNTAGWYISADFHLYLLAPILFLVYYYYSNFAFIWTLLLLLIGIVISLLPHIVWNIPHYYESPSQDTLWSAALSFTVYYWRTDPHIVSYVFGMFCGYLIRQKPNLYCGGRIGESLLWITCTALTFISMLWNNNLVDFYLPISKTDLRIFIGISKLIYLSGWFWLFYACATGRGGFVNRFFSWRGFRPMSNLSFEICLLHVMVIFYRVGIARDLSVYSSYHVWTITCFDYVLTFVLSLVFFVLVSAPFANLVNIFLKTHEKTQKPTND